MKYYVDFAAKSGFEYMLVDAGWTARNSITEMNGRVDIPALCAYAKTKGVRVWIWVHWSGSTGRWKRPSRCMKSGAWPASSSTSCRATTRR